MSAGAGGRIGWTALFAAAFGFVEAAVVVYLRALYYPAGFTFPLQPMAPALVTVEFVREGATVLMLGAVGMLAARHAAGRVGAFLLGFGVWDITFYLWLKLLLGWPATLLDWDILFLLPLPWIGPVIAPLAIAGVMVGVGILMMRREGNVRWFRPAVWCWALMGTTVLLVSFLRDTDATLHGAMPQPYSYGMLTAGLLCFLAGVWTALHPRTPSRRS